MPPGYEGLSVTYGWQYSEAAQALVVKQPALYRVGEDRHFCLRTTWLRTLTGWERTEYKAQWTHLASARTRIGVFCDRGAFVFERPELPAAPALSTDVHPPGGPTVGHYGFKSDVQVSLSAME